MADGKVPKLRASCDGCNESKVRCSQTKPQCGRCMRLGITCKYGLSRRSHKTAPRIGASQPASENILGDLSDTTGVSSSPDWGRAHPRDAEGALEVALKATTTFQEDGAAAADKALLSYTKPIPNFDLFAENLADCSSPNMTTAFDTEFDTMNGLGVAAGDFLGQFLQSSDCSSGTGDGRFSSELREEPLSPPSGRCNCSHLSVRQLLILPFRSDDESSDLDNQFAKLKHAINVADECISCVCASRDELSICMAARIFLFPFTSLPLFFSLPLSLALYISPSLSQSLSLASRANFGSHD